MNPIPQGEGEVAISGLRLPGQSRMPGDEMCMNCSIWRLVPMNTSPLVGPSKSSYSMGFSLEDPEVRSRVKHSAMTSDLRIFNEYYC